MRSRAIDIDLRLLRYFVAAADELHFARAAARLDVTPPTLSHQMRKLEDELGVALFSRANRRVELTPAGRTLLPAARRVLDASREFSATAESVAAGTAGTVRLAYTGTTRETLVPRLARRLATEHPNIALDVRETVNDRVVELVRVEEADLGLVRSPDLPPGIGHAVVERQRLVVFLPVGDPRAARSEIALDQLAGLTIAMWPRERSPDLHDQLTARLAAAGLSVDERWERHQDLLSVLAGDAAVIGPPALGAHRAGIAATPLTPALETTMVLVWRTHDTTPATTALRDLFAELAAAGGSGAGASAAPTS
jgi:DNA-binding transcriptional LysR family regulator